MCVSGDETIVKERMSWEGSAVAVRGAYKRYTPSAVILRGLDMTVAEATM